MAQAVQSTSSSLFSYQCMQKLKEGILWGSTKAFGITALGWGLKHVLQSSRLSTLPSGILAVGSLTAAGFGIIASTTIASKKLKLPSLIRPSFSAALLFTGAAALHTINQGSSVFSLVGIRNAVESVSCAPAVLGSGMSVAMASLAKGAEKEQERETSPVTKDQEKAAEEFNEPYRVISSIAVGGVAMTVGFLFAHLGGSFSALIMTKIAVCSVENARTCLKKKTPVNVTQKLANEMVKASINAARCGAYVAAIGAVSAVYAAANFSTALRTAVGIGAYYQMNKV